MYPKCVQQQGYKVMIYDPVEDHENDNIDIEVVFDNLERYSASYFTIKNLIRLMEKNAQTGECNSGQYFWTIDMVIVRDLREETILESIQHLIIEGEFKMAFMRLENDPDYTYSSRCE